MKSSFESKSKLGRALGLGALLALSLACDEQTPQASVPNAGINVLLVTVDTLRPDHLGTYGYPRATSPAIDALASRGVSFDAAYTYWPKTRGSFASLFTSLYASQHGLTVRDRDLPDFNQTLAETFSDAGYRTAAAVDNGNLAARLGFAQGFDDYLETFLDADTTEIERTEQITSFGESFLARDDDERPFFLWLHYVNPHTPYEPPDELLAQFSGDGVVPRGPELEPVVGYHGGVNRKLAIEGATWGDYLDRYDAEIRLADQHIGRVLEALSQSAHASSTLVVFTSDHGESLGEHNYFFEHGHDLFIPSLRIPLIVSFPGFLPTGERVTSMVSNLDLYPTMLDLAQVSFPPGLEGRSVLPLVRGTAARLHDQVFFENDQHLTAITNGRLKLIHYPATESNEERCELYDMYTDPAEEQDRYAGAGSRIAPFVAELGSFRTRTLAWQQETSSRRDPAVTDAQLAEAARRNLAALGYVPDEPVAEATAPRPPALRCP